MRIPLLTTLTLTLLLACGESSPDTQPDAGNQTPDAGNQTPDAGDETPDAGDETPDAGDETPDAGDETPDAGGEPVSGGDFQCAKNSDCGTGSCNARAPGGFCNTCTAAEEELCTPAGASNAFGCAFGTCNQFCDSDADCPFGLTCAGSGLCGLRSCKDEPCPGDYFCDTSFTTPRCVRPSCSTLEDCPGNAPCVGGYCIVEAL